jgi:basic membrane protein A and related proteins
VPTDAPKNMQLFADLHYDIVVTVGALLADPSVTFARSHPGIEVIQVDPTGQQGTPANWVGLAFREDQAGFLAGALAGLSTRSGVIGEVFGLAVPAAGRYRAGFEHGARYTNPRVDVRGVYQPACSCSRDFNDPEWGQARAMDLIGQGADVVFGAGGNTGNGALVAARQQGKICIGVDVDEYVSFPAVSSCLLTSAEKHLALAVRTALADAVHGRIQPGLLRFDAANGGVGIAPYHDYEGRVPATVKSRIKDIQARLVSGTLQTGVDAS